MEKRYFIRGSNGALYSQMDILDWGKRILQDTLGNDYVQKYPITQPRFDVLKPAEASKFETEADALAMFTHEDLASPDAFAGATVEAIEA
jgi:hypothetical protein